MKIYGAIMSVATLIKLLTIINVNFIMSDTFCAVLLGINLVYALVLCLIYV